ncbi:type II toxin-antitoxin system RelE/ParE family toxin [Aureibacter tunicatorum]|uniref:mRNA-degrading endonuclease RelE of RelBE toxin-antitoxin system n=1 Tax=Aureibacter tunicatorum TaxID=866807 RepID=A0AAE4BT30_9BACT|nr:type II toxin-antitoxin system RelE/ParE family toxin [Aureibacter tunicatorum]MDR6241794.1 hypothetical protein [Aureibacter tunicatorum]BDD07414.1 hypothetical protein AUTU_48970 [Aureibacter tunicatorum]
MSYSIIATQNFRKEIKKLNKKYSSLKTDFSALLEVLESDPKKGIDLGNNCYKIRMAISSKGKGKSGGARVITCFKIQHNCLYLISIFDKSDKENISDKDLKIFLSQLED